LRQCDICLCSRRFQVVVATRNLFVLACCSPATMMGDRVYFTNLYYMQIIQKIVSSGLIAAMLLMTHQTFAQANNKNQLPIGTTYTSEAPGENWGTVIYFPQYHKAPGSKNGDNVNDKAERTQRETYEIMNYLVDEKDINLIMVEGELTGDVEQRERHDVQNELKALELLQQEYERLEAVLETNPVDREAQSELFNKIEKAIHNVERQIWLKGAPYTVWSQHSDVKLVGAENLETREESAKIVREYIYIKDRLKPKKSNNKGLALKLEMLKKLRDARDDEKEKKNDTDLDDLEIMAKEQKNNKAYRQIGEFQDAVAEASRLMKAENEVKTNKKTTVSRTKNPFADIDDTQTLQGLEKRSKEKIQEVVIDQRNRETAENFATALRNQNQTIGMLQFGAGHEEGLVNELNKQGLKVIVVVPEEVHTKKAKNSHSKMTVLR